MKKITSIHEFDPARVKPLPNQPRKRFSGIKELAESISEIGQATPGIVTLIEHDPAFDAQLVDGERRLRACKMAGRDFLAEVKDAASDDDIFAMSFAANFGKQDHDAVEIAEALQRMKDAGKTVIQVARIAGKTEAWVYQHLSILKLHPEVQAMMIRPKSENHIPLSFPLAQLLVPLDEPLQIKLANKITRNGGMRLAQARRTIFQERQDAGIAQTRHSTGPKALFGIGRMLETATNRIGIYIDMPGPKLAGIIDSIDDQDDKQALLDTIDELIENLSGLGEVIKVRIAKANPDKRLMRQSA